MEDLLKSKVLALSRKNWFFYKTITLAKGVVGKLGGLGGGKSIKVTVRQIEEKHCWKE